MVAALFFAPVTLLLNQTDETQSVSVTDNGESGFRFDLEPHSIATLQW